LDLLNQHAVKEEQQQEQEQNIYIPEGCPLLPVEKDRRMDQQGE
jgi:hypothetical protein